MAEKDASEKILESYNDVFSDIVNVLLFNGRQVLGADELDVNVNEYLSHVTANI